jgi:hypothetical protein
MQTDMPTDWAFIAKRWVTPTLRRGEDQPYLRMEFLEWEPPND